MLCRFENTHDSKEVLSARSGQRQFGALGKDTLDSKENLPVTDENVQRSIWEALGIYIAKQLKNGKGVWIPKLGHFTFTGLNVDLAVSYILNIS